MELIENGITSLITGKTLEEGISIIKEHSLEYRVVSEDGEYYVLHRDFKDRRVNLHLKNNIIVGAYRG